MRHLIIFAAALGLAACGSGEQGAQTGDAEPAIETPAAATPAIHPVAPTSPTIDTDAIKARLPSGSVLETPTFDASGAATASGEVKGDKAPVYAVAMAAGQTLKVSFSPSNDNLYMNVKNAADTTGAAVHRGDTDGQNATLKASEPTVYLIEPYQPRAMARRNEVGAFTLTLKRE